MKIIKRNGSEVIFDREKIVIAVTKANNSVAPSARMTPVQIKRIAEDVESAAMNINRPLGVEEIQDMVEDQIMNQRAFDVARSYITYRYTRALVRRSNTTDEQILSLLECNGKKRDNTDEKLTLNSVQRDYMAGEVSKDITKRILLPPDIVEAHARGLIHFHNTDFFAQHMHNSSLINLEDMLQNGTVISGTLIEKPKGFLSACSIAVQIIAQVASCQYGGQSISLAHLAPFVDVSRRKIRAQIASEMTEAGVSLSDDQTDALTQARLRDEIKNGVQMIQYSVITLMTANRPAPLLTVFMYLGEAKEKREKDDLALIIEEVLRRRYQGVKNEDGVWVSPDFPKLLYVLEEDNIHKDSPYYYLTELAAECTEKNALPEYISEKIMRKNRNGCCCSSMGDRSFLTPYAQKDGREQYYGRFNQGVVTVNLVDIGISADKNLDRFRQIFDERMELCHRALKCRYERLKGTVSDASPILWQHGALLRLKKGEIIDEYLCGGYSTLSLGYAGLWECVYSLTGKKLTEPEGEELGLMIMRMLNEYTEKWKKEDNIEYTLYGTSPDGILQKFANAVKKRFGIAEGVSDKDCITDSCQIPASEEINAFDKALLEAKFQALSLGGAISNIVLTAENVQSAIQFVYDNIMYAEIKKA